MFTFILASRILFICFAIFSTILIPLREGYLGNLSDPGAPYLIWIWANLDGRHFLNIATFGYHNFDFAFFPLYPLLISLVNKFLLIPAMYAGILISIICFLLAVVVFYKIIKLDYQEKIAKLAVILLTFFPLSFFYQSVYADSLFLLLSTTSFYFARRGNWILSGLFAGGATLTRLAGLALVPALLFEWILQHKKIIKEWKRSFIIFWNTNFITLSLAILGLLIYLLYLEFVHGDFLLFQTSMSAWRQGEFTFPPQVVFRYLKIFATLDKGLLVYWVAVFEFIATIAYFAFTFYVAKKVRLSYAVFMFFILLFPTFTGTFAGIPRYILHTFPGFIGLALLLERRKELLFLSIGVFLLLGFIFTALFTRGYFIA